MADQGGDEPIVFRIFCADFTDRTEMLDNAGGTTKNITRPLFEEKVALGSNAGHMALVMNYKEHRAGTRSDSNNWDTGTTIAILGDFRGPDNLLDPSQIARGTLTIARETSTGKKGKPTHT